MIDVRVLKPICVIDRVCVFLLQGQFGETNH